ncbi:MAG: bactofilin family protein [Rhodospirillales bacterium]
MFSKTSKQDSKARKAPPPPPVKPAAPSIVSTDLKVVGDLVSEGEIQVDGVINGDIRSKILLVGEKAVINGEIFADSVTVHGTVNGQIKAERVSLARTARVTGDILHDSLSIENGAYLEGHCKRIEPNPVPTEKLDSEPLADPVAVVADSSSPTQAAATMASEGGTLKPKGAAVITPARAVATPAE